MSTVTGRAAEDARAGLAEVKGDCPASSNGGHSYVREGGTWTCKLCGGTR